MRRIKPSLCINFAILLWETLFFRTKFYKLVRVRPRNYSNFRHDKCMNINEDPHLKINNFVGTF